ncbi:dihydrofolate reductase [Propionibacteriaceae bacterium Y2011]
MSFTPIGPGEVVAIAAVLTDGVIGADGDQPWSDPADFARFKQLTRGHVMIMGRRTYDAIGRALPGRHTIVLTRDSGWRAHGKGAEAVRVVDGLDAALALAATTWPESGIGILGGGEVYRLAMPVTTRLEITEVPLRLPGDVTFPEIDPQQWREVDRRPSDGFSWVTYRRVAVDGPDWPATT